MKLTHAVRKLSTSHGRRPRLRAGLATCVLALAPTLVALAAPTGAQAATGSKWGYVEGSVTANAAYSRQSNGGHPTITHLGTGDYRVTFPGLASSANNGTVQVTRDGGTGGCQVNGWHNSSGNVIAEVLCFQPGGAPLDSFFTAEYSVGAGTPAFAYGWDDLPSGSGTLPSLWSFDGKGGALTSTWNGTGSYTVHIPHLAGSNGTVKVTPWGFTPTLCTIGGWGGNNVNVHCADYSGNPRNSAFMITFANHLPLLGVHRTSGYSWVYDAVNNFTATGPYQYDSAGGAIGVENLGTGTYVVRFHGFGQDHGNVQATTYGDTYGVQCNADGWDGSFSLQNVYVTCTDTAGTLVNSLFTVQFTL